MLSCNPLQRFETIYFVLYREITFLGKSTKNLDFIKMGGWRQISNMLPLSKHLGQSCIHNPPL